PAPTCHRSVTGIPSNELFMGTSDSKSNHHTRNSRDKRVFTFLKRNLSTEGISNVLIQENTKSIKLTLKLLDNQFKFSLSFRISVRLLLVLFEVTLSCLEFKRLHGEPIDSTVK